jgi:hypothetical protein
VTPWGVVIRLDWIIRSSLEHQPMDGMVIGHSASAETALTSPLRSSRVEPTRAWRIITSDQHSTAWDGERLLFDFNYQAMGISPQECFDRAYKEELTPGKLRVTHLAKHWKTEVRH